nr:MAG TPA: hypothetical protein [Caudoviricetes sp.]
MCGGGPASSLRLGLSRAVRSVSERRPDAVVLRDSWSDSNYGLEIDRLTVDRRGWA